MTVILVIFKNKRFRWYYMMHCLICFFLLISVSQVPDAAQELSNIQGILSKYDFEAQSTEVSMIDIL